MITHEQAAFIRVAILLDDWDSIPSGVLPSGFYSGPDGCDLELKLRAALAEYEAHYTTVEKSELARLQALERKIEAFLGSMRRTKCAIEIGTPEQMWVSFNQNEDCWELNLHEPVDGRYFIETQSQGDAMRKAFELFELFEVPKEAEG